VSGECEEGSATIELVWLVLLLIVPLVYLLLSVLEVQRAAYATSAASAAAAKAYVRAPDVATAQARARLAAAAALEGRGVDAADVQVVCRPTPSDCLRPGSSVRVRVSGAQRLPFVPDVLGGPVASVAVDSTHTEPYGSYRAEAPR
jgi:hypothetical protein